jgi:hypothetical protein
MASRINRSCSELFHALLSRASFLFRFPLGQAHKVAISIDPQHAEAFNNIGVLELRKGAVEQAKANFGTSATLAPHRYSAWT